MSDTVSFFSVNEMEVAAILLELPHLIFESESGSRFSFTWGAKKRRSVNDESTSRSRLKLLSSSSSPPSPPFVLNKTLVGPTPTSDNKNNNDGTATTTKVGASSPATPLSFSPSDESDEKPKRSKRKVSLKRRREELLQIIEELTKSKGLLQREVENVKRYYGEQKSLNLELKAIKQQLIIGRGKMENPQLEINHYPHQHPQPQQHQTCSTIQQHPLIVENSDNQRRQILSMMMPCSSSCSNTGLSMVNDNEGPLGIPDLNVCPEESFGVVDFSQPSDLVDMTKNKSLMAAQARQKRIQICRFKNSSNNNNNNSSNKLRYYPFR